jgi:hypothetical protein
MRNRKAVAPAVFVTALAFVGACSESSPTEPRVVEAVGPSLFGGLAPDPARFGGGIDAEFVRIAQEVPGFGGLYYDEAGALVVVMAGDARPMSSRVMAPSLARIGVDASAQPVRVRQAQYDFVALNAAHRAVTPVLGLGGVVFTDADERANRVRIGVEDASARAAVERALAMLDIDREIVVISEAEPIVEMQTLQSQVRPVGGGLQINFTRGTSGFVCTLGFNVRSPGNPNVQGFVTNSHCSDTRGVVVPTPYWQHNRAVANTFIGWEAHDPPHFTGGICPAGRQCRYSDALGVRYEPGIDNLFGAIYRTTASSQFTPGPLTIDPDNPRWTITAEQPFPVVGQSMHKSGRTTGWLIGPLINTCQQTNVANSNITYFCQDRVEATPQGGDSGSPVFLRQGETGNVTLAGILWGGSSNTYVFSAMQNLRFEHEGPGGWITFPGQTPPPPPGSIR